MDTEKKKKEKVGREWTRKRKWVEREGERKSG